MFRIVFAALFGLLTVAITAPAHARDDGWSVVADGQAPRLQDRIVIPVGRKAGRLEKIRLRAVNQRVSIHAVDILFGNGRRQRVSGFVRLRAGDATTNIDLAGDERFIDEVIVSIRPSFSRRPVRLELVGLSAGGSFQSLASERISSGTRSAVIPVGKKRRPIERIRLRVTGNPLYIRRMVVTMGNGDRQLISVYQDIGRGETTAEYELKRFRNRPGRNIESIRVAMARADRRSRIEVEGLPVRSEPRRVAPPRIVDTKPEKPYIFRSMYVSRGLETDRVTFGKDKGRFEAVAFRARKADIRLHEFTVTFGNGKSERVRVKRDLRRGKTTSYYSFGRGRFIQSIKLKYRSLGSSRTRAEMDIYVRPAKKRTARFVRPRANEWVLLGAQSAGIFQTDTDVFHVGKDMGRFRAVRVRAMNQDIRIYGMKIYYGNGSSETVRISGTLREGDSSPSIDLKGRHRFIDRIQFRYRTKLNFEGIARAEVWGLAADGR